MASQLLAAYASIATATTTSESCRSCFPPTHLHLRPLSSPTKLCVSLHPGNPVPSLSSSSPSLILQLHHPGYGGRDPRVFCVSRAVRVGFIGQENCAFCFGSKCSSTSYGSKQAWSCHAVVEARALHQGTERKRTAESMSIRGSTEIKSSHGSREVVVSHSKIEGSICHGLRFHHGSSTYRRGWDGDDHGSLSGSLKKSCLHHGQSLLDLRVFLRKQRTINVCGSMLAGFLKRGFFATENDEKQRQQDRHRALLSLCVQAMVASHMVQSPLLSLLWTKWTCMVDEFCAGGEGGGKVKGLNGQVDCTREPSNTSFQSSLLRVLLIGCVVGALIVMTMNLPVSAGALLDACLWLCLLCSLLYLAAWIARALFCTVMFVSRGGIMALHKSCTRFLPQWVGSLVSSLWSGSSTKSESKRVGSMKRGRLGHFGFLQNILSKQTKL